MQGRRWLWLVQWAAGSSYAGCDCYNATISDLPRYLTRITAQVSRPRPGGVKYSKYSNISRRTESNWKSWSGYKSAVPIKFQLWGVGTQIMDTWPLLNVCQVAIKIIPLATLHFCTRHCCMAPSCKLPSQVPGTKRDWFDVCNGKI